MASEYKQVFANVMNNMKKQNESLQKMNEEIKLIKHAYVTIIQADRHLRKREWISSNFIYKINWYKKNMRYFVKWY